MDTIKDSMKLIAIYLLAVSLRSRWSAEAMHLVLLCFSAVILVLSFVTAIALPSYGTAAGVHEGAWQGIFLHKNQFGAFCAISLIVSLCAAGQREHTKTSIVIIALSMVGMLLSRSGNAIVTAVATAWFAFGIFTISRFGRSTDRLLGWLFFTGATVAIFLMAYLAIDVLFDQLQKDRSLTGRTSIWPQAIAGIAESPVWGHGIGAFWSERAYFVNTGESYVIPHAHNGYLDLLLDLGVIGGLAFLAFLSKFIKTHIYRGRMQRGSMLPLTILVFILVANIATSSLFSPNYFLFLLFLLLPRPTASYKRSCP
ncbi:O-antigen ligase family protein [Stenotrophomonas sp. YIM B06876]|uniref:O-antigen ligase family protein n=1 Tax=Stenotrophomonas sp. YIM B06876 TaxID=3060211 RepID=UPI00273A2E25|nr:O-antigen ligase family protein [Stenotrophomonas sp. YIM B06876]